MDHAARACARVAAAAAAVARAGWGLVLAVAIVGGCGGAQFDGTLYRSEQVAFRLGPVPARWSRLEHSEARLAFRDAEANASILVNARCGASAEDVPLLALTNHLFLLFTDRRIQRQEVVPFDGREAMHTELTADLDGVPMRYDVWVLKKDDCVYDLVYFAPPETADRGLADFARMVRGFATVRTDAD